MNLFLSLADICEGNPLLNISNISDVYELNNGGVLEVRIEMNNKNSYSLNCSMIDFRKKLNDFAYLSGEIKILK